MQNVRVLSLFDGMACGHIAFNVAGLDVESYDAYEIDKYAIKVATTNFPDIKEHGDVFKEDFTKYKGQIDFVVGGSPCTYWSIAQSTDKRETTASGIGWELFNQYVRAVREAEPRYFIYENNKSMSQEIRKSISDTFGFEPIHINSALVSAQKRDRLYWVGIRNDDGTYRKARIEQPSDKGILLRDILDGMAGSDKARTVTASVGRTTMREYLIKSQNTMAAELIPKPSYIGNIPNEQGELVDHQATRIYDVEGKSICIKANGGGQGAKTGLYAEPIHITEDGKSETIKAQYGKSAPANYFHEGTYGASGVAEPTDAKGFSMAGTFGDRKVSTSEKGYCLAANLSSDMDAKCIEELPLNPTKEGDKAQCIRANYYKVNDRDIIGNDVDHRTGAIAPTDPMNKDAYEVKDGQITYKGKQYPIKLPDGWYRIRKLSVDECKRLQTVPEWYDMSCISKTQAYKCLGNGWTVDVIVHLIRSALADE